MLTTSGEEARSLLAMASGDAVAVPAGTAALPFRADQDTVLLLGCLALLEPVSLGSGWALRREAARAPARRDWAAGEGHGDLNVFGDRPRLSAPPLAGRPVAR